MAIVQNVKLHIREFILLEHDDVQGEKIPQTDGKFLISIFKSQDKQKFLKHNKFDRDTCTHFLEWRKGSNKILKRRKKSKSSTIPSKTWEEIITYPRFKVSRLYEAKIMAISS